MITMNRRRFLTAVGAAVIAPRRPAWAQVPAVPPATAPAQAPRLRVCDLVELGRTGIRASRLAIGTGTRAGREQRELGEQGLIRLLRHALDQGVQWWDTADLYKTQTLMRAALREIPRDRVTITSKTSARDAAGIKADIERFRRELGTDYIDILLLHCLTDGDWPDKMRPAMEALSQARAAGHVRAVGCSCHTFEALTAAMNEPWVEVNLARFNPFARVMDVAKPEEVPRVAGVLAEMHRRGKVVYGMKILGEGALQGDDIDRSLRFALAQPWLSGFTIGFSSPAQIDDIARRVEAVDIRRPASLPA